MDQRKTEGIPVNHVFVLECAEYHLCRNSVDTGKKCRQRYTDKGIMAEGIMVNADKGIMAEAIKIAELTSKTSLVLKNISGCGHGHVKVHDPLTRGWILFYWHIG